MSWWLLTLLPVLALLAQDFYRTQRRMRRHGVIDFTGHRWKDAA